MTITKRIAALLMAAALLFCLAACDNSDGDMNQYLENNGIEQNIPVSGTDPGALPGGEEVDTPVYGDELPEVLISTWSVVDIYQYAAASDISEQEAMDREYANGISFGYNCFTRAGDNIQDAVFAINSNASYADMQALGIQTSGLEQLYGQDARITSVGISTAEGSQCTTVFLINDAVLVAFGSGMNVFTYESVEAVG
ncbi:MAG: hypothetical protein E7559_07630 [Ruminococcaceae bacterium]|nr:hypothetical protein [Oscillospiraceae bacterium]